MATTTVRKAPYKDFLQPALHRRFSQTAVVLLAVSYLEAVLLSHKSSWLWFWFPIGPTGVRTAFIFTCGLSILLLRIAHYHVGFRTTGPGYQTTGKVITKLQTYETLFWYGFSSLLFSHVFLWAMDEEVNLSWITYISGQRARLNERPLFFVCYMATCALTQTIAHYWGDVDRLILGPSSVDAPAVTGDPFRRLFRTLPVLLIKSVTGAFISIPLSLFLYYFIFRTIVWGWSLSFLRIFYNLPKTNIVPRIWPSDIYVLARCLEAGSLVFFGWTTGNAAFSTFMVREPMKNGKPLTSESKDANGSLLNGLKSKKLSIKAFAMWELAFIASNFETRRRAIYEDIDRADGPMWSQICALCTDLLKVVERRVDDFGKPPPETPAASADAKDEKQRVSAPLKSDPVLASGSGAVTVRGELEKRLRKVIQSPGSTPASKLKPIAKKTWNEAKDRMLTREQQEAVSPESVKGKVMHWVLKAMEFEYVATFFQHDFRTQFAAAVLGTPYAEPTLCANAIHVLSQLCVHSLQEDQFGNVHRDVPSIIRTMTAVVKKLEAFRASFPVHWTDYKTTRESPEVDEIVQALKTGLNQIVSQFEPYSSDLRLTLTDIRLAKEAAGMVNTEREERRAPRTGTREMEEAFGRRYTRH